MRRLSGLPLVLGLAWAAVTVVYAQTSTLESRLKAAFVSKFPQFVEWPATALTGRATMDICVAHAAPLERDLAELVSGEKLNGRPVVVRAVAREDDLLNCHVLFLPALQRGDDRSRLLADVGSRPILTVGDDPRFLEDGGIIRLRALDGRVRFDINAGAAQRVGLRVSSQLLSLAVSVLGGAP